MTTSTIGVAAIGLGFMGRTHVRAYQDAAAAGWPCRLAAVCDGAPERLSGDDVSEGNIEASGGPSKLFDPADVFTTGDPAELFARDDVHAVSICTPTDTHVDLAIAALEAGKHVLVEKPVAVASADVERLAAAAEASGRTCMPAFCMRFWPGWDWLKAAVEAGTYGAVRTATFQRLANPPGWSQAFYGDDARTGGALVDLHIHDADFVRWCFGDPEGVDAAGTRAHVTALYRYAGGPAHVVAEGGWDHAPGFPFTMRYVVNFERATADFLFGRDEPLRLHVDGETRAVDVGDGAGYDGEIRHFVDLVAGRTDEPRATLADAVAVARLLEREAASLD